MSDYTPTTEQVHEGYRKTLRKVDSVYSLVLPEDADAAFDRWLEQVGKAERLAERERIIKIIESEAEIHEDKLIDPHELIERIKGEEA
jgi:hypothetical protein